MEKFLNPFRPGAGHPPPHLAGRRGEKEEFKKLLTQEVILQNLIITGLRGIGKTVLLDELKPTAMSQKWLWVGSDLSESASVNESKIAQKLLSDLSVSTSGIVIPDSDSNLGFSIGQNKKTLTYSDLEVLYAKHPGLVSDKLKFVLEYVWSCLKNTGTKGIIFAYDEAQTISDHNRQKEFPLSVLLEIFQSVQRKGIPFMLVLAGLPTLHGNLVAARTYSERMFSVLELKRLDSKDSEDAILTPIRKDKCPVTFTPETVKQIIGESHGYPYFLQFISRELFDVFIQQIEVTGKIMPIGMDGIIKKLDKDFFSARWARTTDRQRQLLSIAANLPNSNDEFTILEITEASKKTKHQFGASHVNQIFTALTRDGLIYQPRRGRYSFAVPLLGKFILRQEIESQREKQMALL